ncbi:EXOSTOSIN HEPARAN SULFATE GLYCOSYLTRANSFERASE -RELATED [Salix viminalis]|uniref:EXOSTOSIN HEPARAN SULFATE GLYCOSYLTRANSFERASE -RELATED n=1 Tax=Salix viminalis TaxID=40686 RepID=A0A9Q0YXD8_SALVM|nr:EXOSTOSIN HEPARAN SULFATE GLYCOSYLTRANSFERASE -RELATED [Salix viminalis]
MKRPPKLQQKRLLEMLVLAVLLSCSCIALFGFYTHRAFLTSTSPLAPRSTAFYQIQNDHLHHYNRQNLSLNAPQPAATLFPKPPPPPPQTNAVGSVLETGPYHNWELFAADFQEMMQHLKIFVYPDIFNKSSPFANIFLPRENPLDNPKLGNYFSEHMFKGADHFYVCCHSVGREAPSKHHGLRNNAIQLTCCSSYFQRFYLSHKDVGLPQVWPRTDQTALNPPHARHRLVYFAGRVQNSQVRQQLINLWGNDTEFDIFNGSPTFPYEEGFKRSKFCLHVKGYEVNTARVSDAIHYGCIPVIISNYYDLPFSNVLDWSKFSVVINQRDIASLKTKLLSIKREVYLRMYHDLCKVRRHFFWHTTPRGYDSFYMTAYQLWLRRGTLRLSY